MAPSFKPLFSRALSLDPDRLHFAAHSHHLWPDASFDGQMRAWEEANRHADRKWDLVFGEVIPEARANVAAELGLPDPSSVVFASNTHDFLVRIFSGLERRPARVLTSEGEFHSFRRQGQRWEEAGQVEITRVPLEPFDSFGERFVEAARGGDFEVILVSQVFYRTGQVFDRLDELAALADPGGPWVIVDGYHGFMGVPTDLSRLGDRLFYVAGGYKYAMSGEGAGFLHAPPSFCPRPVITGWFAEFGDLQGPPGGVGYLADAGRFWGATFDVSALYRFNGVRRMLADQGLDTSAVALHARRLMELFQGAVRRGDCGRLGDARLINPVEHDGKHARFLAFQHRQAAVWKAALEAANVITDVRDDTLRFGFGLYQDEADVERLIEICRRTL